MVGHWRGSRRSKHRHSVESSAYWQYLLNRELAKSRRPTPSTAWGPSREKCYPTPVACSARTACASSSPRSRTKRATAERSRPRSSNGSSGPERRHTGSIRSFDEATQSCMRRSRSLRVTGSTESSPADDALAFERIVVSGVKRRNRPRADLQIDPNADGACAPTLFSGIPYPRRQTGVAADLPDRCR